MSPSQSSPTSTSASPLVTLARHEMLAYLRHPLFIIGVACPEPCSRQVPTRIPRRCST